jgi:hypothetical protein
MAEKPITLGQAIDAIVEALSALPNDARATALAAASAHVGLQLNVPERDLQKPSAVTEETNREPPMQAEFAPREEVRDIRSFKEQKQPASAQQMACVVAYYLQELAPADERKSTISTNDLDRYFKQAKFKLPTDIGQVLKNAKKAGYFDAAERGQYKLNAVGYNLVSHGLPVSSKT